MKFIKNIPILLLALAITLINCRKDEFDSKEIILLPQGDDVSTTVTGFVKSDNGRGISAATVQIGDQTVMTNDVGFYIVRDVLVKDLGFPITVKKEEYITNIARTSPIENAHTYQDVSLSTGNFLQFNSDQGIAIGDSLTGFSLTISANTMVNPDGSLYNGIIQSTYKWFDPSLSEALDLMPGNLEGFNKDGDRVSLGTYGMFSAQFRGSDGQELNLNPEATASIIMPIPESMLNSAPAEIPTWSLDEEFGIWIEEAIARKEDNSYVIEVDHFSFWNCDAPFPLTFLKGTIKDSNGSPISNSRLNMTFQDGNQFITRPGYTNDQGQFNGKVPRNQPLLLSMNHSICGEIKVEEIGPFTSESENLDLTIEVPGEFYDIQGVLLGCNDEPVSNGVVYLQLDGDIILQTALTNEIGRYFFYNVCRNNDLKVQGIDMTAALSGQSEFFDVEETITIPEIILCEPFEEFVIISNPNITITFFNPFTSYTSDTLIIQGENGEGSFDITLGNPMEGFNSAFTVSVNLINNNLRCDNNFSHTLCSEALSFNISDLDTVQQTIRGEINGVLYTGNLEEPDETTAEDVSIQFQVKYQ